MLYFPGKDIVWLKARLDDVLEDEAAGSATTGAAAGDVNEQSAVQASISDRKRKLLWDLQQLDPTGPWLESIAPRTTRAIFCDR